MSGNLVTNILGKIEMYSEANVEINAQILTATKKSNEILSKEIYSELKKQTSAIDKLGEIITRLTSDNTTELKKQTSTIDKLSNNIAKLIGTGGDVSFSLFGGEGKMTKAFVKFFEVAKPESVDKLSKSIEILSMSILKFAEAVNKVDPKKLQFLTTFFSTVSKGIAIFALTVALAAPALLIGTLVTLPLLILWITAFTLLDKMDKSVKDGARAIGYMGIAIAVLALATIGYIMVHGSPKDAIINSIVVGLSVMILTLPMIFIAKYGKDLAKGALGMAVISLSIFLLGLAVDSFFKAVGGDISDPTSVIIGSAAIGASIMLIGFSLVAVGSFATEIIKGSLGILIASVSVIVLAKGMEMWMNAGVTWESIGMVGAAVLGLGVLMAAAGVLASLIVQGAAVMLLSAIAIIPLAMGMEIWMKAGVTWESIGMINATILGLGTVLSGWGLAAMFILPGAAALAVASVGIYIFTAGISKFKEAKWTETDTDVLVSSLDGVLKGFINIFDEISFEDIAKAMFGTLLLSSLGNSLSQFAQGIAAMAELQVPEYAVKDGKLILVGTKQLDPNFAEKVATNIELMLNALVEPLAKFGENEGLIFNGPVGNGIQLLGDLGNTLSEFAQGVQAMAELQVPIYEVKNGKLVLKSTKPLDPNFAQKVATNIDMLINALIDPIKKLGAESGFFFDSNFEDGLELMSDIGTPIADISKGIEAFSKIDASGISGKTIADNLTALVKGLNESFSSANGYDPEQGEELRYFADTLGMLKDNIQFKDPKNTTSAFMEIKDAINGIDSKKLTDLNKLMENFNKLAESIKENFDDIDEILEKLLEVIDQLGESREIQVTGPVNTTPVAAQSNTDIAKEVKISNINEVIEGLNAIKNVLLGTIDVRLEEGLLNK